MPHHVASRRTRLALPGAACAAMFAVLAVLVHGRWGPMQRLDTRLGEGPQRLTYDHAGLRALWQIVQLVFSPDLLGVLVLLAAVGLAVRRHRRAGLWGAGVLVVARALTALAKVTVGRERPVWQHPVEVLHSASFPSTHASMSAACAGVLAVWAWQLVRRRHLRRWILTVLGVLTVLVGADRVFLGVHNVSDVVAGWLLAGAVLLLGAVVYDPAPRSIALDHDPLPVAGPVPSRRLGVVLNPAKIDDLEGFRALTRRLAADAGFEEVVWRETTVEDTGYSMAHQAAVEGCTLVLAVGGDGTLRAVCEELAGTGVPVGVVPAGTGNLLARNLEIPLHLQAAVDTALNGQDRAVDMVEVSGDQMDDAVFLVMAGMGFDAAIMEGVNEDFKARVGWLAYVWSALKSLMYPVIRVEVSVDGGDFSRHHARTVVIGNVGHLQAGMPLIPDAEIDDGELDVVLLYPRGFWSWVPLAARVLTRNRRTDETITRFKGRSVVVRASADAPRQLDGDLIPAGRELRASCVHGRLLVRVPR